MHPCHPLALYTIIAVALLAASYPIWRPMPEDETAVERRQAQEAAANQAQAKRVFRPVSYENSRILSDQEGNTYSRKDL